MIARHEGSTTALSSRTSASPEPQTYALRELRSPCTWCSPGPSVHVTVSPRFGHRLVDLSSCHEPCHDGDRLGLGAAGPGLDRPVIPWLASDTCRAGSLCKRRIREQVVAAGRTAVARAAPAPTADHPSLVGADALGRRSVVWWPGRGRQHGGRCADWPSVAGRWWPRRFRSRRCGGGRGWRWSRCCCWSPPPRRGVRRRCGRGWPAPGSPRRSTTGSRPRACCCSWSSPRCWGCCGCPSAWSRTACCVTDRRRAGSGWPWRWCRRCGCSPRPCGRYPSWVGRGQCWA